MASANGPIRTAVDPELRFELRPVVLPAGFEVQTESVALWDKARTTRSFLQFAKSGDTKQVPTIEEAIEGEKTAAADLLKAEAISSVVVTEIEQLFQQIIKGG